MTRIDFIRKLKRDKQFTEVHHGGLVLRGNNCNIQDGVVLGLDGLGYEQNEFGEYEKFPHYNMVNIGNNVDILAGTVVCRGTLRNTVIGDGCKIGGHCQIGHGVHLGKNCLIGTFTCIAGSCDIGDNLCTGQFVYIDSHTKIGNNVKIRSFSYVKGEIPDNATLQGVPAVIV